MGSSSSNPTSLGVWMTTRNKAAMTAIVLGAALALASPQGCELPIPGTGPIIQGDGLNVLVIEETEDRPSYTPGQLNVLTSTQVRRVVEDLGGEMVVLDVSSDWSKLDPKWTQAATRPREGLPWWIVSSPKGGVEESLPDGVGLALETISQYVPSRE